MRAAVGDRLRLSGQNAGQPQRTGQIIEVRGVDGEPPYLVRFSDGSTSLVIPDPGTLIEHSGPVQASSADLVFRVTPSQRRALVITAAAAVAVAAVLAGATALASDPGGRLEAFAAAVGIAALLTLYYSVAYMVAYTACTAAGLRVRGVLGRRHLPWARVRDIAVRDYAYSRYRGPSRYAYSRYGQPSRPLRIVIVTADDGRRFWLGAPIDGGQGLGDPQFEDKIQQLRAYWRSALRA